MAFRTATMRYVFRQAVQLFGEAAVDLGHAPRPVPGMPFSI
jgi:hypothetical protein